MKTLIAAVGAQILVNWLYGSCKRSYRGEPTKKSAEEESDDGSDDFEVISAGTGEAPEELEELEKKKTKTRRKSIKRRKPKTMNQRSMWRGQVKHSTCSKIVGTWRTTQPTKGNHVMFAGNAQRVPSKEVEAVQVHQRKDQKFASRRPIRSTTKWIVRLSKCGG